jgi:biotin carboxylase
LRRILIVEPISSGSQYKFHTDANLYETYALFGIDYGDQHFSRQIRDLQKQVDAELADERYKKIFHLDDYGSLDDFIETLKAYDIGAVIPGSEYGVTNAEKIADALSLRNNDMGKSGVRRNKFLMQQALKESGLNYIPYVYTDDLNEALDFFSVHRKIVLKEQEGVCSERVRVCGSEAEVEKAFHEIIGTYNIENEINAKVVAQKFIEGREYSVDSVNLNGTHQTLHIFRNKKIIIDGNPVNDTVILIKDIDSSVRRILAFEKKCLDVLGFRVGASHSQFFIDKDENVYLIETAARVPGHIPNVPEDMERYLFGYNYFKLILDSYFEDEPAPVTYAPKLCFGIKLFIAYRDYKKIRPSRQLRDLEWIMSMVYNEDAESNPKSDSLRTMLGECLVVESSYEELSAKLDILKGLEDDDALFDEV